MVLLFWGRKNKQLKNLPSCLSLFAFFPIPSSSLPSSCCLRVEVWLVEKQELTMILPGIYFEKLKPREGRSFLATKNFFIPRHKGSRISPYAREPQLRKRWVWSKQRGVSQAVQLRGSEILELKLLLRASWAKRFIVSLMKDYPRCATGASASQKWQGALRGSKVNISAAICVDWWDDTGPSLLLSVASPLPTPISDSKTVAWPNDRGAQKYRFNIEANSIVSENKVILFVCLGVWIVILTTFLLFSQFPPSPSPNLC